MFLIICPAGSHGVGWSHPMAARMESVMVSAYMMTWPSALRAARPMVWIREVSRTKESFLIRIQNGHQSDLRNIQTLSQQVDTYQHIEHIQTHIPDDFRHAPAYQCQNAGTSPGCLLPSYNPSDPLPSAWSAW